MTNLYNSNPIPDRVGMPVYFRDAQGKLGQFLATSDILDDLGRAIEDCQDQVCEELISAGEWYKHCAVLALISGGKA